MSGSGILAIDAGTHAVRAVLYDEAGRARFAATREIGLQRPGPGRAEQDAAEILARLRDVVDEATRAARTDGLALRAAGLATQRSTVVAWDRETGRPLAPALGWQDTRAADRLSRLADREAEISERTGLRLSPHYGASKMAWLLERSEEVAAAHRRGVLALAPLAAFLLAGLRPGEPLAVDHANAGRTLLWNLAARDWDETLLRLFGIPAETLPVGRPILDDWGTVGDSGPPLRAVTGDQNAAVFADGVLPRGIARVNLGTGAFILAPTAEGDPPVPRLLRGIAASDARGTEFLAEGTVNGAGAALTWAESAWGIPGAARLVDEAWRDATEPPVFLNGVGGVGSPWWRPDLEPELVGGADADALARVRAVTESVLFLLRANVDAMRSAGVPLHGIRVSGGLSRSDAMCRGLAAVTGLPVERRDDREATARGVAWLAAGRPARWGEEKAADRFDPVSDPGLERRGRSFRREMERRLGPLPPR